MAKGNYNDLYDFWCESHISNSGDDKLLRDVVSFMNCRSESLNKRKSIRQLTKEFLQSYYDGKTKS